MANLVTRYRPLEKLSETMYVCMCTAIIPGYSFEYVPMPLSSGGVGLFIDELLNYRVLEKISNEAFQALWVEITFENKKNVICGILYRQHNSPERFQVYFDESIEKFTYSRKDIVIMGDFNIDLLKCESSNYSHDFLSSLQSCYLTPAIDKPTRVRSTSTTLIDNIFINNPDKVVACGWPLYIHLQKWHLSITCLLCKKIYIGKTGRRLVDRFCEHLQDAEKTSKPVACHFNLPNHSHHNTTNCGLSLHYRNTESCKNFEQKFFFQMDTLYPHGINERLSLHLFIQKFMSSYNDISTNGKAPPHSHKNPQHPTILPFAVTKG